MITQKYNQGDNVIKIEMAESMEDAKLNGFIGNEYIRYFVNEKLTQYSTMIQFMIEETRKNKEKFIPEEKDLLSLRNQMLKTQREEIKKGFENLKKTYKENNVPDDILKNIDKSIEKINSIGVRISK